MGEALFVFINAISHRKRRWLVTINRADYHKLVCSLETAVASNIYIGYHKSLTALVTINGVGYHKLFWLPLSAPTASVTINCAVIKNGIGYTINCIDYHQLHRFLS